jgi:hypothetical protein
MMGEEAFVITAISATTFMFAAEIAVMRSLFFTARLGAIVEAKKCLRILDRN